MPDFEAASPAHFRPHGTSEREPVGVFAALQNAKELFEGRWKNRAYEVTKKNQRRTYTINRPPDQWPTRFARVVRQKTIRAWLAPLAGTRIDRPRAFSTRTRSDFARGTSERTQLTPGAASIAAGVTSSAYAA